MRLAAGAAWVMVIVSLSAGGYALVVRESLVSASAALVVSVGLAIGGWLAWRGDARAGYLCGAATFLLAVYFAYRFISTERLFPSALLLIISFCVLFFIILGVFLGLYRQNSAE